GLAMVMSDFKGASSIPTIKGRSLPWVKTINASVAKFSDDGEEAAKLLDNHILKEDMKGYENKVEVETNSAAQLDKESRELLKQAEDDYKNGLITLETYHSLNSGLIAGGASFIKELAQNKITDEAVEGFTKKTWEWLVQSSQNMQVGAIIRELGESNIIQGIKKGAEKLGAGKIGKAISSKAFAIGTVVLEGGVRSASAYFDKDSEAYHNVGKSVVSGTVDTIANVGPVDGALLGATLGGPIGAGIGFTAGLLIQGFKYYNPDIADDVKEIGYDFVDNVSKVGKSVKTEVNRMVSSAGKAFEKFSSKPLAVASGWFG
ncbi:hypothetical protein ACEE14_10035, partial [Streptococcus pluranimalium]